MIKVYIYFDPNLDYSRKIIKKLFLKYDSRININLVVNLDKDHEIYHADLSSAEKSMTFGQVICNADIFILVGDLDKKIEDISGILNSNGIFSIVINNHIDRYTEYFDFSIILKSSKITWETILKKYLKYANNRKKEISLNSQIKRIAFITPLNCKSAIASYSIQTIQELSKFLMVDVYTNDYEVNNYFNARSIYKLSIFPYLSSNYDQVITVLGDSPFHNGMLNYCLNHNKLVILHDSTLFSFYHYTYGYNNLKSLYFLLNPPKVEKSVFEFNLIKLSKTFRCIEPFIESSKITFIHSKSLYNQLISQYHNVRYLPFPIIDKNSVRRLSVEQRIEVRRSLGFEDSSIVLVSLGNISSHKLSLEILRSYIDVCKILNTKSIYLVFVGSLQLNKSDTEEFQKLAKKSNKIRYFKEYLSEDSYYNYLTASDFAIQLRSTNLYQVSGALSECIALGKYTLSCVDLTNSIDAPSFIDPIDTNQKLSISCITDAILRTIKDELYNKDNLIETNSYISDHSFSKYTRKLLDSLNNE